MIRRVLPFICFFFVCLSLAPAQGASLELPVTECYVIAKFSHPAGTFYGIGAAYNIGKLSLGIEGYASGMNGYGSFAMQALGYLGVKIPFAFGPVSIVPGADYSLGVFTADLFEESIQHALGLGVQVGLQLSSLSLRIGAKCNLEQVVYMDAFSLANPIVPTYSITLGLGFHRSGRRSAPASNSWLP